MNKFANILVCLNLLSVLLPQPGYIHPDEFFQSTEIVAGDILQVDHFRAWEFNSSVPVRSIVFPYIVSGPSISLLKFLNSTQIFNFEISPFKIIIATRFPLAILSISGYLATHHLASVFGSDTYLSTILWSSSYVTWTYFTRTFSNSVEAVLFSMILLLILSSHELQEKKSTNPCVSEDFKSKRNSGNQFKQKGTDNGTSIEKYKHTKIRALVIGFFTMAGFFNRPTFLVFAFVPIIYWLYNVKFFYNWKNICNLLGVVMFISIGSVSAFFSFVFIDTLYFNSNFQDDIIEIIQKLFDDEFSLASLILGVQDLLTKAVITPWNFVQYNINSENLAEHGLHPHYTHLFVNLPLLTGPLFLPIVFMTLISIIGFFKTPKFTNYFSSSTIWLTLMMLLPVFTLSVFPHQEPRFLIPLLPVLVVLGAKAVKAMSPASLSFYVLWGMFNFILVLIYGFLHQSALIPSISIYQQKMVQSKSSTIQHHAIFYKTYPPPRHLFLIKPHIDLQVHDLAGSSLQSLSSLIKNTRANCIRSKKKCRLNVFLPSTVTPRAQKDLSQFKLESTSICPHLSMESPPRLRAWWAKRIDLKEFLSDFCLDVLRIS